MPFISICVPTYKRPENIIRLLQSIQRQTYTDFEVIVTDNSPDDVVKNAIDQGNYPFPIRYQRNIPAVSMGENWNEGIKNATGTWIKTMHDDDWFSDEHSLAKFAAATKDTSAFIFSTYNIYEENTKTTKSRIINRGSIPKLQKNPYLLFANNIIGPPTVVMYHHSLKDLYNPHLRWLIDIDHYFRIISKSELIGIDELLVNVCHNDIQTTKSCFRQREVEIPDALILYHQYKHRLTNTIQTYNAWWRLMRNLEIRNESEVAEHANGMDVPVFLKRIISFQRRFSLQLLQKGVISKLLMTFHYIFVFKRDV